MTRTGSFERKREQAECKTFKELMYLGMRRGYKNPGYWATRVMEARENKDKENQGVV